MGVIRDNLEPTDFADAVCKVTDWHNFDGHLVSAYRIWICRCTNHWFQRHEWQPIGKNQTQIDEWIYLGMKRQREIPDHFKQDGLKLIQEANQ